MSGRLSIQAGFERLLLYYEPWHACDLLNIALRKNHVRVWRDGVLLSPADIRDEGLYVRAAIEPDGRWCCTITSNQPLLVRAKVLDVRDDGERRVATLLLPPQPELVWEVDADGIAALLPQAPGRKAGRKSAHNWTGVVDLELLRLQRIGSPLLENFRELETHLLAHVQQETGQPITEPKRFRQRIRAFPGVQN